MDLKAILKARGLNDEQSDKLIGDPAYATILESFVKEAEDGKTAYQKAQEVEANLKNWNEREVVPYVRQADEKVAKVSAQLAATQAHMKALKEAGYDIPDSYLESAPAPAKAVEPVKAGIGAEDLDKRAYDIARTNMELVDLTNRHRRLTGEDLELSTEYADFEANRRPSENLRSYISRKYDHDGLQAKSRQAAEQKKLDDYAAERVKEELAKFKQTHGANGETALPRSSRFDNIQKEPERAQLWQTKSGREKATQQRLEKYSNLVQ